MMSLSREQFRTILLSDFKRGLDPIESHKNLVVAFGYLAPSLCTVRRWFNKFGRGQRSLKDGDRSGRPATAVTTKIIMRVEQLIKERRNITHRQIQSTCGIGSAAADKILHQHLGARKLASRWIPHLLTSDQKRCRMNWCRQMLKSFSNGGSKRVWDIVTGDTTWIYSYDPETKQQSTVWVFGHEPPPTKVFRDKSVTKQMVAVFFRRNGLVAVVPLLERKTVNADWYSTVCLPEVFDVLKKSRPKVGQCARSYGIQDIGSFERNGHPVGRSSAV